MKILYGKSQTFSKNTVSPPEMTEKVKVSSPKKENSLLVGGSLNTNQPSI